MRKEIFVNPEFSSLTGFVTEIPEQFSRTGQEIHTGRNEVREVIAGDIPLTIKYFKRITWINRFILAGIRKSKARRSYENSERLISKGFNSPTPIAYINCYKYGLLYRSYYVCLHTNYRPIADIFDLPLSESEEALRFFARFTYQLHRSGVYHGDFGKWNILYNYEGNKYNFSLIDNNRMIFRLYSYWRGVRNLERLKMPVERMGIIAAEYAHEANVNDIKTLNAMTFFRLRRITQVACKQWIKKLIHTISGKNHYSSDTPKGLNKIVSP